MSALPTPGRRGLFLLAGLTLLLGFFLIRPGIGLDGISYFGYLRSAVVDGDLDLRNEFTFLGVARQDFNMTPEGHVRNVFAIGSAVLWTPFYISGMGDARLLHHLTGEDPVAGYSRLHVLYVYVATACLGLAALVLAWRFAARFVPSARALHATIAVWLASPFVYYQFMKGDYSHVPSALCVGLFIVVWTTGRARRDLRGHLLLGVLGGLAAMVRWQDVLVLGLPVLDLLGPAARRLGHRLNRIPRELRSGALVVRVSPVASPGPSTPSAGALLARGGLLLGGAILGALPQLVYWRITLGEWLAVPQGRGFLVWSRPAIAETLFSSYHGLFGWHPLLALSLIGLVLLVRRHRGLILPLLLLFALETYLNSIVWDWEAGVSFGGRRFLSLTLIFVLGLARLYAALPVPVAAAATSLGVLGNLLLLHEFHFGLIDRRWFVSFAEIWDRHREMLSRLPEVVAALGRDHLAHQWPAATWAVLLPALLWLLFTTWCLSLRGPRRRALIGGLLVALLGGQAVYVRAAIVSRPSPTAWERRGDWALIDYRWYENAHYQLDPFRPDYPGKRHFMNLGGRRLLHDGIPFMIQDPLRRPLENGDAVTTCLQRDFRAEIPLAPSPTRAVWLALDGGVLLGHAGEPAGRCALTYDDGTRTEALLVAGRDVWDYWETPPPGRILWRGEPPAVLTWYRLAADSTRRPEHVLILSPPGESSPGPGLTVFAVTQEVTQGDPLPVPLGETVNTDFMQDPFRPGFALNHFPHLTPGEVRWADVPYRILDVDPATGRGTVITTAYQEDMRLKIPLAPLLTSRLCLVVDGGGIRGLGGLVLGDIVVHYDRGEPTRQHVVAGRDVWDYWENPPPERVLWRGSDLETLTGLEVPLDPGRVPRTLELVSAGARGNHRIVAGYAVFALSQQLVAPAS